MINYVMQEICLWGVCVCANMCKDVSPLSVHCVSNVIDANTRVDSMTLLMFSVKARLTRLHTLETVVLYSTLAVCVLAFALVVVVVVVIASKMIIKRGIVPLASNYDKSLQ